jgi:D-alanyl-D-alanine carboxypeptidase
MGWLRSEVPRGLRWGVCSLVAAFSLVAVAGQNADARRRKATGSSYSPAYAAIVVDANSGNVLHASNPDALRHPASLTKIMTLFLLFERLEAGKLKLDTPLKVSEHAEDQAPTKLGLEDGETIRVEEAIKGMVTRSANDAAVVVAEALADSEEEFARLMTRKAHALGMSKTVYKNASGLPNDSQVTTARDQAILGRAIQERFPAYYKYFQTQSFVFRGHTIGNHNRLLGRVEGVDGIKTGFTNASGFNLVTSLRRDKRHVVAVVLGGSSAGSRDSRMRELLSQYVPSASTKRTAPMIAEAATPKNEASKEASKSEGAKIDAIKLEMAKKEPVRATPADAKPEGQHFDLASASSVPVHLDLPPATVGQRTAPGSSDPIQPVAVKTFNVKGNNTVALAAPAPFAGLPRPSEPTREPTRTETARAETPRTETARAEPARTEPTRTEPTRIAAAAPAGGALPPPPPGARPGVLGVLPANVAMATPPVDPATSAPEAVKPRPRSGWIIQIGAYPDEDEAKRRLGMVKIKALRMLSTADPFTEPTVKDGTTYYRARFAGLDKDQAEAVCKFLKRNDVECVAIKN